MPPPIQKKKKDRWYPKAINQQPGKAQNEDMCMLGTSAARMKLAIYPRLQKPVAQEPKHTTSMLTIKRSVSYSSHMVPCQRGAPNTF